MTDSPQNRGTPFEPTGHNMMAVSIPVAVGTTQGRSTNRYVRKGLSVARYWKQSR